MMRCLLKCQMSVVHKGVESRQAVGVAEVDYAIRIAVRFLESVPSQVQGNALKRLLMAPREPAAHERLDQPHSMRLEQLSKVRRRRTRREE